TPRAGRSSAGLPAGGVGSTLISCGNLCGFGFEFTLVRVTGKSRDDLQAAMALVRGGNLGQPFQFKNFRD
ncbi:DUF520 family protein, partial [Salmonella enterica subsp. enterica serovar Montevideo]|nr:DUF520 family protein [Salmonella enterica subsp. enterica serovar Montevideo]